MAPFLHIRRFALAAALSLFSAVLLATISNARGDIYNFVDYPAYETDIATGTTDTLSGDIITDGATGSLTAADIVGGSYTIQTATYGSITSPISPGSFGLIGTLWATHTSLTIPAPTNQGVTNQLLFEDQNLPPGPYSGGTTLLEYYRSTAAVSNDEFWATYNNGGNWLAGWANTEQYPNLILGTADSWVIATAVPEPSTLALFGVGAIGLLAYAWRRRRV